MARWRFGLRQLFLWTAAIAVGLVALRSASAMWVALTLALAVAALTVSILLVIFRRGPQRAYWIGFATCGWAYLLLVLLSWTLGPGISGDSPLRAHNLLTQQLASGAYHRLFDKALDQYSAQQAAQYQASLAAMGSSYGNMYGGDYGGSGTMAGGGGMASAGYDSSAMSSGMPVAAGTPGGPAPPVGPPPVPDEGHFIAIAHSLWTLLLAALGGCLACWLYLTGPGRPERQAPVAA